MIQIHDNRQMKIKYYQTIKETKLEEEKIQFK